MGFLDLFVKPENETASLAQPAPTASVSQPLQQQYIQPSPAGTVDAKLMKHFEGILEKANVPGADFYEFSKTLEGMTAISHDHSRNRIALSYL